MRQHVDESEARRVFREMVSEELEELRKTPDMRVRPFGEFGREKLVRYCDDGQLEYVARRNVERAVERTLRNKESTTCA